MNTQGFTQQSIMEALKALPISRGDKRVYFDQNYFLWRDAKKWHLGSVSDETMSMYVEDTGSFAAIYNETLGYLATL
jgi:hypothetical protein